MRWLSINGFQRSLDFFNSIETLTAKNTTTTSSNVALRLLSDWVYRSQYRLRNTECRGPHIGPTLDLKVHTLNWSGFPFDSWTFGPQDIWAPGYSISELKVHLPITTIASGRICGIQKIRTAIYRNLLLAEASKWSCDSGKLRKKIILQPPWSILKRGSGGRGKALSWKLLLGSGWKWNLTKINHQRERCKPFSRSLRSRIQVVLETTCAVQTQVVSLSTSLFLLESQYGRMNSNGEAWSH